MTIENSVTLVIAKKEDLPNLKKTYKHPLLWQWLKRLVLH